MIGAMTLSLLTKELEGVLQGEDVMFSNISTDTRSLTKGDLYLALVGENFDGNNFVDQAQNKGACAALVSAQIDSELPTLQVIDSHAALGTIANLNRQRSAAKIVALTGSQGKTTVKEMLGAILSGCATCLITEANLNNTIGVPLTLLKVAAQHQFVVIEMGASAAGEIAFSAKATQPNIALITNASSTHIEGFGSLEKIVAAKGEIIDGLKDDGVLLLNADDAHVDSWIDRAGNKKIVRFSGENNSTVAEYFATEVELQNDGTSCFSLHTPIGRQKIITNFPGKHNIVNAVAAAATAIEAGANLENVAQGLADLNPVKGRLSQFVGLNNCVVIDDSYNASPDSFFAAIDVLASIPGKKILIAGDMKELGTETDSAHTLVGDYASSAGLDALWATGEKSRLVIDAFKGAGKHFPNKDELVRALVSLASPGLTVLIKGSRGARMDEVVMALKPSGEIQC